MKAAESDDQAFGSHAVTGGRASANGEWAICCPGGGIRSAACCLGALRSLDRGGSLSGVKWILGVSGGSDIASGLDLAPGEVVHPWAHGWFRRPQEVPGLPQQGEIWTCKPGWRTGAPWDVCADAAGYPTYPTDSTAALSVPEPTADNGISRAAEARLRSG